MKPPRRRGAFSFRCEYIEVAERVAARHIDQSIALFISAKRMPELAIQRDRTGPERAPLVGRIIARRVDRPAAGKPNAELRTRHAPSTASSVLAAAERSPPLRELDEDLVRSHRRASRRVDGFDHAVGFSADDVLHLHRLDDADGFARTIEAIDHASGRVNFTPSISGAMSRVPGSRLPNDYGQWTIVAANRPVAVWPTADVIPSFVPVTEVLPPSGVRAAIR